MSGTRYQLLTGFKVRGRDGVVADLRPMEREVITHLVLSMTTADEVVIESITDLMWPEDDGARKKFTGQLSNVRRKLGADVPPVAKRMPLRLDITRHDVDVWVFADAFADAEIGRRPWGDVVRCWPGDAGWPSGMVDHPAVDWLTNRLAAALRLHAKELTQRGSPASTVLAELERLVRVAPSDESAWLLLIGETARSRGEAAARSTMMRGATVLAERGSGAQGFTSAAENVIADVVSARAVPSERPTPVSGVERAALAGEIPRSDLVDGLARKIRESVVTVLDGEPGIGKSWLADRAARASGLDSMSWVFRAGNSGFGFQTALATHFSGRGSQAFLNLLDQEQIGGVRYDADEKAVLVAEILDTLPTLIVLDDFHLIDTVSPTGQFVHELIDEIERREGSSRVLIVTRHTPGALAGRLPTTLSGLTEPETEEVLRKLKVELSPEHLELVCEWTSNLKLLRLFAGWVVDRRADPEMIDELLRRPQAWPAGRSFLLDSFLAPLSPGESKLVSALALLRTSVPSSALWDAAEALGLTPFDTVDQLIQRHILEASVGAVDSYYLHGLIRDFFRDALGQGDARERHVVAAHAQRRAGAIVEELHHLAEAGELEAALDRLVEVEDDAVQSGHASELLDLLESWPVATDIARPDIASVHADLLRLSGRLSDAAEVYENLASGPGDPLYRALGAIGQATCLKGLAQWERALDAIDVALAQLSRADGDPAVLLGVCRTVAGSVQAQLGKFDEAREALFAGVALIRASHDRGQVSRLRGASRLVRPEIATGTALCDLGWLELMAGDLGEAETNLHDAISIQKRIGDHWGRCESLAWLGRCYWQGAQWAEAVATHHESLDLARDLGHVRQEALARRHLGLLAWNQGRDEVALRETESALRTYEWMGDLYGQVACIENLAAIAFDQERYPEARKYLAAAEEICESIESDDFYAYVVLYQAKIELRDASAGEAQARAQSGLAAAQSAGTILLSQNYSFFYYGMAMRAQAEALLILGRPGSSVALLRAAAMRYREMPSEYQALKCDYWLARALHVSGEPQAAVELLRAAAEGFRTLAAARDRDRANALLDEWTS